MRHSFPQLLMIAVVAPHDSRRLYTRSHFHALHRRAHSQWTMQPTERAEYAATKAAARCLRCSFFLGFPTLELPSFLWLMFCTGLKAVHSAEIPTWSGRSLSMRFGSLRRPSLLQKSYSFHQLQHCALRFCFSTSRERINSWEHAISSKYSWFGSRRALYVSN